MKLKYMVFVLSANLVVTVSAFAQLNPPGGQYFFNQYLANPALGGTEEGLVLSGMIRKQFSTTPGGPFTQALTATYQLNPKAGVGINFYNDKAGLLRQTRASGTYAFHLPLNERDKQLHFGVGIGFMNERIDQSEVIGHDDPSIARVNDREMVLDGSFGLAYTSDGLSVQSAVPHLKQIFTKENDRNTIDRALFFNAVAYKFTLEQGADQWFIEPKIAYRVIKGMDNIIDAGAQVGIIQGQLRFMSIYHSSKAASFGVGFYGINGLGVHAIYTSATSSIINPLGNNFELNLKIALRKK